MSRMSGAVLLTLGLSGAMLVGLGGCAAPGSPAERSTVQFRPVLATISQVGADPLTEDELEPLGQLDCEALATPLDPPAAEPVTACDDDGEGYLLGPAELDDGDLAAVSASPPPKGATQGWGVLVVFDADGTARFADLTARLLTHPAGDPRNRLALVLDGRVISAPFINAAITEGQMLISGSFTEESAKRLARQLGG